MVSTLRFPDLKGLVLLLATTALTLCASAGETVKVFYVDRDFQGENPTGNSWLSAYPSLQDAIDGASKAGGGSQVTGRTGESPATSATPATSDAPDAAVSRRRRTAPDVSAIGVAPVRLRPA